MAFFNIKKASQEPADESIQSILPENIPENEINDLLFSETAPMNEEIPITEQSVDEPVEQPKKKSILTMDLKDLFKSRKKKDESSEDEEDDEPNEKKSIFTMDVKDLVKLKPKSKKGQIKRSKRTMNFVHHQSSFNLMKVLPSVLIIVAVLLVFVRVGFMDMLDKKTLAYDQLARKQEQLAAISTRLVGYDELAAQFGRYSYGWMSADEIGTVNRLDILQLVEDEIVPNAKVENISVSGNTLTMNIYEITLEEASAMVKQLETHELVSTAVIYSANAPEATDARIFLSITLTKGAEL